ncbi:MAG: tRNA uridine-5-carboxymethylaminomethyl(34) synthesis GTPase MnmE [Chloracidobacterium sp.]|uniref:tRNA modification GTPase MnmE n=1 Tax=Chloracidobacterium validum TaxID=2821543 RepID=A0ABX8BDC0_9BACT|nr:tRNA uridine-5-carboxymethylaminomethyl(34) synthesis GTPase MnmE [Chloracidobacterium validum]QUW03659.1 tRNA uridine-5-carboxymethylaminomethyl(34) synthesis GTPase MnmE [Chloracidobacterium validum]
MPTYDWQDTIVAIATPPGHGSIGVVRISGDQAQSIGSTLFRGRRSLAKHPFRTLRGTFVDMAADETIDDGLAVYFPAPRSFTGEDVVELHAHGSPVVLRRIVACALREGARAARPGEFTLRAVRHGRLDLAQAEGIRDLIAAQTTYQARLAAQQARGALSTQLYAFKEQLLTTIVHLESAVEFVEEQLDTRSRTALVADLAELEAKLHGLAATYRTGRLVREGVSLAIIGRPNVGKSSLFNALLDTDRAIVTAIAGTTRDTLQETATIGDLPVRLIDTAGIRDTSDIVERMGVERSYTALADADVVLFVGDAAAGPHPDEKRVLDHLRQRQAICVVNKSDLVPAVDSFQKLLRQHHLDLPVVGVSAHTRAGLDQLKATIQQVAVGTTFDAGHDWLITEARHAAALTTAAAALRQARETLQAGHSEEVPLAGLHQALQALGDITGETNIEAIFDRVFATFCIGK